jgi:hypothetical protein
VFNQVSVIQSLAQTDRVEHILVSLRLVVVPGFNNLFQVLSAWKPWEKGDIVGCVFIRRC